MSTITEHPNTAVVRGFYEALARGDIERVTDLCSPDVVVTMPGRGPLSGRYSGRDAALGFLGRLNAATEGTYRAELLGLYTGDGQVVAVHHGTGTRGEKTLDVEAALVFEVAGGSVTAITVHQQRQDEWDRFFD
jgi:ketosteroid isomerase-like protein